MMRVFSVPLHHRSARVRGPGWMQIARTCTSSSLQVSTTTLRPYQREVLEDALFQVQSGTSTRLLFPLATGLGKTVLFVHLVKALRERHLVKAQRGVLVLVHRDELISQAVDAFASLGTGLRVGIEQGQRSILDADSGCQGHLDVLVGSIQTLGGRKDAGSGDNNTAPKVNLTRLHAVQDWLGPLWCGAVVVDEAHHLRAGNSYDRVLSAFGCGSGHLDISWDMRPRGTPAVGTGDVSPPVLFGFTATPYRTDGAPLRRTALNANTAHVRGNDANIGTDHSLLPRCASQSGFFDTTVGAGMDLLWGVRNGYLVDPHMYVVRDAAASREPLLANPETAHIGGGANRSESIDNGTLAPIATAIEQLGGQRVLVFCESVAHAHALACLLLQRGRVSGASVVDGATEAEERRRLVKNFRSGAIVAQRPHDGGSGSAHGPFVLLNYAVFTEGTDLPECDTVMIARQISSPVLYMQILGRGTRPLLERRQLQHLRDNGCDETDCERCAHLRREAIAASPKPFVKVIEIVSGNAAPASTRLANLIFGLHENFDADGQSLTHVGAAIDDVRDRCHALISADRGLDKLDEGAIADAQDPRLTALFDTHVRLSHDLSSDGGNTPHVNQLIDVLLSDIRNLKQVELLVTRFGLLWHAAQQRWRAEQRARKQRKRLLDGIKRGIQVGDTLAVGAASLNMRAQSSVSKPGNIAHEAPVVCIAAVDGLDGPEPAKPVIVMQDGDGRQWRWRTQQLAPWVRGLGRKERVDLTALAGLDHKLVLCGSIQRVVATGEYEVTRCRLQWAEID